MNELSRLACEIKVKHVAWPMLPIIMADLKTGEIVYCSTPVAEIFGYRPEELDGKQLELLVPPDLTEQHATWRTGMNVSGVRLMGVGRQVRGKHKDGRLIPLHVGLASFEDEGKIIGMAFVIDLSGIVHYAEPRPEAEEGSKQCS